MDVWMDVKDGLRIAYSNLKQKRLSVIQFSYHIHFPLDIFHVCQFLISTIVVILFPLNTVSQCLSYYRDFLTPQMLNPSHFRLLPSSSSFLCVIFFSLFAIFSFWMCFILSFCLFSFCLCHIFTLALLCLPYFCFI